MTSNPTGTVTFLFTDIEGSTRRWEEQAEAMKIALARHDTILRSSIEAHGGHVFKTVGDAFYAAFPIAPDALASALESQRALSAETWGEIGELRVRMALHTGTAHGRDGDYFGPPLNRVARLLNAGHGGQTLLSLATQELVRDQLPEGAHLRDLGSHRLRDLIRPEQIFELVAPPLPANFPDLKTLDARPNNLQIQPTPLLGREREVEQACAQLRREDVRLLTLTGPGGTGKTRLGLQVAADLLDDYKDGVYFVALAPLSDPTLVISTIAQTLGVQQTGRSILQSLQDYLREKTLLLALDNFEQVTAAAPEVAGLLANAPRLNILVTSRVPLHLRGEHEFAVSPLALPDCKHLPTLAALSQYASVELFIERARAVKPDFAVNNDNAPAVAEICVRLDGLPLAIELAAARVKLLSPQAMLARLKDPLKFLTGGARELSTRQQTLRGAIAWSHDLLDVNEKRLFRRLGVFVGGCTLETVEAVCNAGGDLGVDVFDGVASLVDKSLLRLLEASDGEPRFFMLETIREYALERLTESGENEELQNRHATFFLTFAEQAENELHGFQQMNWLEKLEVEHDNLRAALGWLMRREEAQRGLHLAGALADFWVIRGHIIEADRHFGMLFALRDASQPTAVRAKALDCAAYFASDRTKASSWMEESLQLWRELGDKRGLVRATISLGNSQGFRGERAKGRALLEQSVAMARELGDKWCLALALVWLGAIMLRQGEITAAREAEEEGIKLCREVGDRRIMAIALFHLGNVMTFQGEPEKHRLLHEECLAILRFFKDGRGIANSLRNLGHLDLSTGDYPAAAVSFKATLEAYRQSGFNKEIAIALFMLGEVASCQGDEVGARSFYSDGLATARATGNDSFLSDELARLGVVASENDRADEARRCFDECMTISRKLGDKKAIAWLLKLFGDLARVEGDSEQANRFYVDSLDLARESHDREFLARLLGELGHVAFDQSDYVKALGFWNERMTLHRELQAKAWIAWSLSNFGFVAHYQGRYEETSSLFKEALVIFRNLGFTPGIARSLLGCAIAKHAQGDFAKARALSEESMTMYRSVTSAESLSSSEGRDYVVRVGEGLGYLGGTKDVAYASQCLARVACAQGDIPAARAALKESMGIYRQRRDRRGIAEGLAGFAKVAHAQRDADRAAYLFGAAESLHRIVGPRLNPLDHHDHASVVAGLRSELGDEVFTTAWAQGRALTTEQAIEYAPGE